MVLESVPLNGRFYNYPGGLTTPTCDEAVEWYVNQNPIRINKKQLKVFQDMWVKTGFNNEFATGQGNNRKVQPLGSRKMSMGTLTYQFDGGVAGASGGSTDDSDGSGGKNILIIFLLLVNVTFCAVIGYLMKQAKDVKGENQA